MFFFFTCILSCMLPLCQWHHFTISLNNIIHIFRKINTVSSPAWSRLSSSAIYNFLTTSHPFFQPFIPPLDLTIHNCITMPSSNESFQQSGPRDSGRELAKSTGSGPEERSWAGHAQISSPKSGSGVPLFPGLQLEERRLEREGGADWDTRDSKSVFRPPVKLDNTLLSNVLLTLYIK